MRMSINSGSTIIRLEFYFTDKTCTFGQQNVYVCPTKRTRLGFKITSLGRGLTTFDEQRPHFNKT